VESGADDVVDAVKQRGGGPKPPQELAVRESGAARKQRGEGCVTREDLEASIATAVTSGYVCAMCVHRKVGCGCPQYEAKMAVLIANRRRVTAGNSRYTKNMGVMMVIALVVFLYWRLVWDYLE